MTRGSELGTQSSDLVRHLARLACLGLTSEQEERYPKEFREIVDYVGQVEAVRTERRPLTTTISGVRHVVREDRVEPSRLADKLLQVTPDTRDRGVRVPPVL